MSLESELARHSALIEAQCKVLEVHGAVMGRLSSALEKMFSAAVRSAKPSESPASAPEEAPAVATAEPQEAPAVATAEPQEAEVKTETMARRGQPTKAEQEAKAKEAAEARKVPEQASTKPAPAGAGAEAGAQSPATVQAAAGSMDQAAFRAEIRKYLASCARNHFDAAVSKIKAELSLGASTKIMDITPEHFGRVLWAFGEAKAGRQFSFEVFDEDVLGAGAGASEDEEI
jgi:outer membrane biosynthesis protein TonB